MQHRYFLTIGGADSAVLVWLNGRQLGAAKDSRLPSDWEVTHLLQPTGNLLAVQVRMPALCQAWCSSTCTGWQAPTIVLWSE